MINIIIVIIINVNANGILVTFDSNGGGSGHRKNGKDNWFRAGNGAVTIGFSFPQPAPAATDDALIQDIIVTQVVSWFNYSRKFSRRIRGNDQLRDRRSVPFRTRSR